MTQKRDFSQSVSLDIGVDKVCGLIARVKAVDVKEGVTDPDSGSNPIDDGNLDSLTTNPDDMTEEEIRERFGDYVGRFDLAPRKGDER